jgi:kynurenine formamidase
MASAVRSGAAFRGTLTSMDEADVLALFDSCSNVGRWGADDAIGTLNLISVEKRLAALALPRSGRMVSLGFDLEIGPTAQEMPSAELACRFHPTDAPIDAHDTLSMNIHGFDVTHLDAPGHVFFEGRGFGGRPVSEIATEDGLAFGSIQPLGERGIVTRGILLDVAATRGVDHLPVDGEIAAVDLDAAEERAGIEISDGDAIFVRSGHGVRKAREGEDHDEMAPHEGVAPDVLPWLHERGVAVYSGDCIERRPSGYPQVPMPLHQIGLVSMGLCILDVPDIEGLASACRDEGRADFLLIVSPLRVPGGTGSAVNPLAVF